MNTTTTMITPTEIVEKQANTLCETLKANFIDYSIKQHERSIYYADAGDVSSVRYHERCIDKLRDGAPTIAFIYHPDCPISKRNAPEFEKFAEMAKDLPVRIFGINVSKEINRLAPEDEHHRVGKLFQTIGPVKTVP